MIVEFIVGGLVGLLEGLISLLPEAGDLMLDGFGSAMSAFLAFDAGLPVSETIAMGMMCLTIIGGIFVTRLLLTIWHAMPGKFS